MSGPERREIAGMVAVVVSFNAEATLERCLESLEESAGEVEGGLDVVVVDNGSTDASRDLVRSSFPRVRLIEASENPGFAAACNLGARASEAERILFLNPDAWLRAGALGGMDWWLLTHPRVGLVAPRLRYVDGSPQFAWAPEVSLLGEALQRLRIPFEGSSWVHSGWLRALSPRPWFSGACLLVRRSAFASVAGFDERFFLYFEDADLGRRLRRSGWQLAQVAGAEVVHAKGGTGAPTRELDYRRSQLHYYACHRPAWERVLLRRYLARRYRHLPPDAPLRRLAEGDRTETAG